MSKSPCYPRSHESIDIVSIPVINTMTPLFHCRSASATLKTIDTLFGWHQHPRNGKIARLPEATRSWVNQMLDDGLPYRSIIEALQHSPTPPPYALSEMNLSNWYRGGYQDWRRQRLLREATSAAVADSPARLSVGQREPTFTESCSTSLTGVIRT